MHLNVQRRRQFSLAALFALLAWLFVVANHVHVRDEDDGHSSSKIHACLVCVLAQPGAGPPAPASIQRYEFAVTVRTPSFVSLTDRHSWSPYLSRGPPRS